MRVRREPDRERLVRSRGRRDQRARSADSFGTHSGSPRSSPRDRVVDHFARCLRAPRPVGDAGDGARARPRLGLRAPPFRLQQTGWFGNAAVGLSYEGLAWITGATVALGGSAPGPRIVGLALLYSIGAHGIMTLNDFKSIRGDRRLGIRSLPAQLGPLGAARVAC